MEGEDEQKDAVMLASVRHLLKWEGSLDGRQTLKESRCEFNSESIKDSWAFTTTNRVRGSGMREPSVGGFC